MSLDADLTNASRETLLMVTAELQAALSEQRATTSELQAALSEQRATTSELQAALSEQRATNSELQAALSEQQATNSEQRATIDELQRRIGDPERRVLPGGQPLGMPGNKPPSRRRQPDEPDDRKPRKQRERGFARRRMEPTRREVHAPESCPECGTGLAGGWVQRTREVIDVPPTPVEVTEHVLLARRCPTCERRRVPRLALDGVAVGRRQRLGVNLMSLIATLREEERLPVRTIQSHLWTVYQLKLSAGAIVEATHRVAQLARPVVADMLERIRGSPVVHADETGWREGGVNGYAWTFSTPRDRYFLRRGRGKEVVDEALGESFSGVLTSDFYAAYDHYPGAKQRCWVHLLREMRDLTARYPDHRRLARWSGAVKRIYLKAKSRAAHAPVRDHRRLTSPEQVKLQEQLLALCRPFLSDKTAPQAKLCRRIERSIQELFVFVSNPDVPSDNNAAERSLRHLVVSRKISGGTRSLRGTESKMTLASLFGAWRARGLNPLVECRNLLVSPQL